MFDILIAFFELLSWILLFLWALFLIRDYNKDKKLTQQKCKDISEIKEELFLIHEHLADLVDDTYGFNDLEGDNNDR